MRSTVLARASSIAFMSAAGRSQTKLPRRALLTHMRLEVFACPSKITLPAASYCVVICAMHDMVEGYYWNGKGKPSYYAAVYERMDDDLSCEGAIGLLAVSDVTFQDDGNAIAWALWQ